MRRDSNCRPRSVVTIDGMPNLAIQPLTKAWATVSAVMSGMGIDSGQPVDASEDVSLMIEVVQQYRCEYGQNEHREL